MSTIEKEIKKGKPIFLEGDASRSLYIIKSGMVSIQKRKGNKFIEISRLHSGEVLGELSFFDRNARSATAIAHTDVELIEVDFVALGKMYDTVPDYIKKIILSVVERLRKANTTIKRLQKGDEFIVSEGGMDQQPDLDDDKE